MSVEVFNHILFNGPISADGIIASTSWEPFQVDEAIALLLKYHFIEKVGTQEGKPLYNLPIVNIEGE